MRRQLKRRVPSGAQLPQRRLLVADEHGARRHCHRGLPAQDHARDERWPPDRRTSGGWRRGPRLAWGASRRGWTGRRGVRMWKAAALRAVSSRGSGGDADGEGFAAEGEGVAVSVACGEDGRRGAGGARAARVRANGGRHRFRPGCCAAGRRRGGAIVIKGERDGASAAGAADQGVGDGLVVRGSAAEAAGERRGRGGGHRGSMQEAVGSR